jgi:hypothetical protein
LKENTPSVGGPGQAGTAERVGISDGGVERLEAVALEHASDGGEHNRRRAKLARGRVEKALRQAGLGADRLVFVAHGIGF